MSLYSAVCVEGLPFKPTDEIMGFNYFVFIIEKGFEFLWVTMFQNKRE